ncbi:MAG TPA: sulfite exporter TauE/SafE family protein [Kofleriaceae bacterium]|nr:sulfite exporter TauE/SafE family protein [Kofleriaceae bacterium]
MTAADVALILVAAAAGGALNAVAGGGSFLTLPALIAAGVPAVAANATSALALWPASVASTLAYRKDFDPSRTLAIALSITSVIGGLAGALLLLRTSNDAFLRLLPWLMLIAAVTFTFGGAIAKRLGAHAPAGAEPTRTSIIVACVLQLAIATYGGYFGGGMGIMMLAYLAAIGMTNIHAMNGLKSLLAVIINGVAIAAFLIDRAIAWTPASIMLAAAIAGGWFGARFARRVPVRVVRAFVMLVGWSMSAYFFWRAYR